MNYLLKRILISIVVFVVVINLVFVLPRLVPGNAADILASGSKVPAQDVKVIEARLGLNQPVTTQYALFLKNMFSWPPYFGVSYLYYPATVSSLFLVRIGWTLLLSALSFLFGVTLAYAFTSYSSLRRGGKFEIGALYTAIIFNSTPIFWVALLLLWIFSVHLGWFPLFGNLGFNPGSGINYWGTLLWHVVLPVITLGMSLYGESYLLLRGSVQEVLKSDYVLAARSRGLRDRILSLRYILRNSMLPLVSVLSFSLASLISRVVLVEAVFGYPGVGDLIVDAVGGRDYPVLQGSLFYLTLMIIVGGLMGDFLMTRLDPRLRIPEVS